MGTSSYCGPTRAARASELLSYQRKGWRLQEKRDGWYVALLAGPCPDCGAAAFTIATYRSGRTATIAEARRSSAHPLAHVLGLHLPGWTFGTLVYGELHVATPAARRREDELGFRGASLFDIGAIGTSDALPTDVVRLTQGLTGALPVRDLSHAPQAERRQELVDLYNRLEVGPAKRVIDVVPEYQDAFRRRYHEIVAEQGGEGAVICDPGAPLGRGKLKIKARHTIDARVVAVQDERLRLDWGGVLFGLSRPRFDVKAGAIVEVEYGDFYDGSAIPRHAKVLRVREDLA